MTAQVMADGVAFEEERLLSAAMVLLFSLLIALCAQISIRLPFTPVPITGATLGVLYAGAILGPRRGAASVLLYLIMGAAGLPFFAGGAAGYHHVFGATGGYLVGFLPASWLTGALARRGWDRSPLSSVALMLAGSAVVFACGLAVLRFFVPPGQVLAQGLYPFLVGDLAKSCLSAGLLPLGWRLLGKR
jgi:biotin transport system substrate-specific component